MSDETGERVIKLPTSWLKIVPLLIAALAGGGGGSWLSSERVAVLETKVSSLEKTVESYRDWLRSLSERTLELERGGGTE